MQPPPVSSVSPVLRDWWWVFDPRQSLRAAAALLAGVGAALFTFALAWFAERTVRLSIERHAGAVFEGLAVQLGEKLDRTIYERYRSLQYTASMAALRDYAASPADRRRILTTLQDSAPDLVWIGLTDAQGRVIAATKGLWEGSSVDARPWFRGAREQPFASSLRDARELPDTLLRPEEGERSARVLDLAVPVSDPDGRFSGVLAAHLSWHWTRDAQVAVVPDTARREQLGITVYSANGEVILDSGGSGWTHPPDTPNLPDRRKFRGHFVEPTSLGTTYLTGFVRSRGFREYRGLGWIIAARQPASRAFAPVGEVRNSIIAWGLALTSAAMIVAWFLAGRVSRRLHSITVAAGRIQSGDVLTVLPSGRGEGELESMCSALGRMVENFREPRK